MLRRNWYPSGMLFLPISLALFVLFLVLIPVFLLFVPAVAFAKLGLNPFLGYVYFLACLVGGSINIPVFREHIQEPAIPDDLSMFMGRFFGIRIPVLRQRVIAINLGGAVLPTLLSLYLLRRVPIEPVVIATTVTTIAAYALSRPVRGVGVVMPAFVPPIIAAVTAVILSREHAPQIAYVSGVMGTLFGADVLRLPQIRRIGGPFLSIGGAGVFDGIYLVGLISVLLA